jgi:2-polyprenyl-3-methyl-5-hydroxy-6-metoxy-1,4-benzoquinol methylase
MCNNSNIEFIENLAVSDIVSIYSSTLGLDVSKELSHIKEIIYCHCNSCDLFFFNPLVAGGENFYSNLQRFDWYYPENKNEYGYAASFVSETDSVLEIGSGKGAFANLISAKNYVGLEFSQTAKQMAANNGVDVVNQSIENHAKNWPDKYDVVCGFQVLEHVSDPRGFIKAAASCVRSGGRLIFSVPSLDSFARYLTNHTLDLPPHHVTRWTDLALCNIARETGLNIESIWHEPLHKVHELSYASTIFSRRANLVMAHHQRLIDRTRIGKLIQRVSLYLGSKYCRVLTDNCSSPRGISVTAVYKKP